MEAQQRAVGRAGIDNPKIAVQDEDPIWRGGDPGGEDIKPEALRVSGRPRGLQDAARGCPALIRQLPHKPARYLCSEGHRYGPPPSTQSLTPYLPVSGWRDVQMRDF